MKPRSLFLPLLLISIGVVLFLINVGTIQGSTWNILNTYWPAILIIGGLDGLYRRDGWVGPLVLIGFGGVLLAGNLGYLNQNAWQLLVRLWPIFLVGIGLDLAFGKGHSTWAALGRVFAGFLLVAVIMWLAVAAPAGGVYQPIQINQSLDGATASSLHFSLAAGEFDLSGKAGSGTLVSGTASLPANDASTPRYTPPKDGKSEYTLESAGVVYRPLNSQDVVWDLMVNSKIPLDLTTNLGAGDMMLDLSGTRVQSLQSNLGVGKTEIILPANVSLEGKIDTAIGEITLRIPSCAAVTLQIDRGLTESQLPAGYIDQNGKVTYTAPAGCSGNKINLDLSLAIGSIQVIKLP